jgi:metal-responsive CopG/Arc/MetJ family transcriptional regulator
MTLIAPRKQMRLSVSLPADLVDWVRARAEVRSEAQSTVVAEALRQLQREERRQTSLRALTLNADFDRETAEEGTAVAATIQGS